MASCAHAQYTLIALHYIIPFTTIWKCYFSRIVWCKFHVHSSFLATATAIKMWPSLKHETRKRLEGNMSIVYWIFWHKTLNKAHLWYCDKLSGTIRYLFERLSMFLYRMVSHSTDRWWYNHFPDKLEKPYMCHICSAPDCNVTLSTAATWSGWYLCVVYHALEPAQWIFMHTLIRIASVTKWVPVIVLIPYTN